MRPSNKHRALCIALVFLLAQCAHGIADSADRAVWRHFTPAQKQLALAGFTDCFSTFMGDKKTFAATDMAAAARLVDNAPNNAEDIPFGNYLLRSMRQAPAAKADAHAEHWKGPTGFHSGLWWRGVENSDREAYVQGVFWCAGISNAIAVANPRDSISHIVEALNNWYVISDDGWKDPRSNARADIPAISALQRIHALQRKKSAAQR